MNIHLAAFQPIFLIWPQSNVKCQIMKVTTKTAELLVIDDRPWLFGIMLGGGAMMFVFAGLKELVQGGIGGIFFLLGATVFMLFFYFFVRRTQAVFHGREGWLEIRRRNLLGYKRIRHDLSEIERAMVESSSDGDGGVNYRVTLIIPRGQSAGRHPLTQVYTGGQAANKASEAINAWLDSYRQAT